MNKWHTKAETEKIALFDREMAGSQNAISATLAVGERNLFSDEIRSCAAKSFSKLDSHPKIG